MLSLLQDFAPHERRNAVLNAAGEALALWVGGPSDVSATRYSPTSGWSAPERVSTLPGSPEGPWVALDADGYRVGSLDEGLPA